MRVEHPVNPPVISAASLKALTSPAASCPVMASTTRSVSLGRMAACTSRSSLIMRGSICARKGGIKAQCPLAVCSTGGSHDATTSLHGLKAVPSHHSFMSATLACVSLALGRHCADLLFTRDAKT